MVVLGLRADFYARCMEYRELVATLRERQLLMETMGSDEIRDAIEKPAAEAGLVIEDNLAELLLRETGIDRGTFSVGTLPLLSFALERTWAYREEKTLTISGYQVDGGVWKAVTKVAEEVYEEMRGRPGGDKAVRTLLLRMVRVGEGTEDTRRRADVTALLSGSANPAEQFALAAFAEVRLITVEDGSAQIAHEALIREWPRLRQWIDEDRSGLLTHQQLTEATAEWHRTGRHTSLLHRGPRLTVARQWFSTPEREAALTPGEREFLTASVRADRHRLWGRVAVLLVVALAGGAVAIWQYRTASESAAQIASRQIALRADALRDGDPATA
ncbi:hypothetical protein [Amycolatopsis sp. cmx-4-61]|uniref:nSTAND1 domain-containing NTPase n=1 Tax=Amycolatopsis sp. cmx-4-61 TaxID=2790937 RepID=UPI003979E1DF